MRATRRTKAAGRIRIGMVYDLRKDYLAEGYSEEETAEFDSEITIDSLERVLTDLGHEVERIGHARALAGRLARGDRWDLVFNIAEGQYGRGRESLVPCLLDAYRIPYTFSDALVCALTLDKSMTKRVARDAGLPTPRFAVVRDAADLAAIKMPFPLFVKPLIEGTGKGTDHRSCVRSRRALNALVRELLRSYPDGLLVEDYLPGREFTTAVLGCGSEARVLGTIEVCIRPNAPARDYTYEVKEKCDQYVDYCKPRDGALVRSIESLALDVYRLLECRDAGRVDIRLDRRGRPAFIEINPLPGINPAHSDLPMIAVQEGLSYAELIGAIVGSALRRAGLRPARR